MKKLFFKNGMSIFIKTSIDFEGRYISVYEVEEKKETFMYSILDGKNPFVNKVIFNDNLDFTSLDHYVILQIAEIIENFNQYFDNLNQ
jgi:hypothetical protein